MPKGQPVLIRVSLIVSTLFLIISAAATAFVSGYGLCFSKFTDAYAELSVLRARAAELETELLHLKNYAVLIDAVTTQGRAARELQKLPLPVRQSVPETTTAENEDCDTSSSEEVSQ